MLVQVRELGTQRGELLLQLGAASGRPTAITATREGGCLFPGELADPCIQ
jgi:hypothetical protein